MQLCANHTRRARWLSQPISPASIADSLSLMANKHWVAEEAAVGRAAPEEATQRQLLQHGLQLTERACGGLEVWDWELCVGSMGYGTGNCV